MNRTMTRGINTLDSDERTRLAELERAVGELRAELERRDLEQIEVENAIGFLDRQQRTLRYVLGGVLLAVFGREEGPSAWMLKMLYPESTGGLPNGQAPAMVFTHPARRWRQFGTRAELIEKATGLGVRGTRAMRREDLVRALWAKRALPGSIAPHRRTDDTAASTAA